MFSLSLQQLLLFLSLTLHSSYQDVHNHRPSKEVRTAATFLNMVVAFMNIVVAFLKIVVVFLRIVVVFMKIVVVFMKIK